MKVRITKCSQDVYWYAKQHVGRTFDVVKTDDGNYEILPLDTGLRLFIESDDCEIVEDSPTE